MHEKRKTERRRWNRVATYPLVDHEGNLVTHNRRRVVDRRLNRARGLGQGESEGPRQLRLRFQGHDVALHGDRLLLGRQSDCDVAVHESVVSRHHARIERRGMAYVLVDTSRNGTFVRFHGTEDIHCIKGGELTLDNPGVMALGSDFKDLVHGSLVHFDLG